MNAAVLPVRDTGRIVKAKKSLTWLMMFSIVMFFAGLTSAYLVSKGGALYWAEFKLPTSFWYSTGLILLSSATIQMALVQARKGASPAPWAVITLLLGLGFSWFQFNGWSQLSRDGFAVTGDLQSVRAEYGADYTITRKGITLVKAGEQLYLPGDIAQEHPMNAEMSETKNAASSYFFVLTGAHYAHIIGGLIALLVISIKAFMGRYGREDHQGLWAGTMYWHFLAGLWVYLLLFLAYVH
ncbi:MAG: cytochrome c oxidase subunit 3 [Flavobacteriales bacterium]